MTLTQTRTDPAKAVTRSYPELLGALAGWFRSRHVGAEEARDLAQETIVRTLVHLRRHGQRTDDLRPLAFRIARNLFVERARRPRPALVSLADAPEPLDTAFEPLERIIAFEDRRTLLRALRSLPPRHQKALDLSLRGRTPADIARLFGIKRNAADALLHRARRRLRLALEGGRGTVGALLGFVGPRLRMAARRCSELASVLDPSAHLISAVAGATAIGVVAVLAHATPPPPVEPPLPSSAPVGAKAVATSPVPRLSGPADAQTPAPPTSPPLTAPPKRAGVSADLGERRVGAWEPVYDPATGRETESGLSVWYRHGTTSGLDTLLDPAASAACTLACAERGR